MARAEHGGRSRFILAAVAGTRCASGLGGVAILCDYRVDLHHLPVTLWQAQAMSDLPPLDQPQAYVVVGPNDQRGPYTMELLISEVVAGRLSDATPVWWPALTDWTTLAAHPAVAAEISRRRAAAAPAPAWATPTPDPYAAPDAYAQPAAAPEPAAPAQAQPEPAPAADPYAAPAPAADPYAAPTPQAAAPQPAASPFAAAEPAPAPAEVSAFVSETVVADAPAAEPADTVDAEVVEIIDVTELTDDDGEVVAEVVEVTEVVELDPEVLAHYTALIGRSGRRADAQARVDGVDEALVLAVVDGATSKGFGLDDRVDVERGHELRFGESGGDLLVISLGRIGSTRPEDIRSGHVPITVSYRSGSYEGSVEPGDGSHGAVVITADEWTGQATSSVNLFLGLEDYVDESLELDTDAVTRDIGAVVTVVRDRLS